MINSRLIKEIVCDSINNHPDEFLTPKKNWMFIKQEMIDSRKRNREIVEARQFCHLFADLTTTKAGKEFGSVDHAVVIHSKRRLNQLISIDDRTESIWADISFLITKQLVIERTIKF